MRLRNLPVVVVAAMVLVSVASTADADVVLLDRFEYPNGNLVGNGGWTQFGTENGGPIQVVSEEMGFQGGGSAQDVSQGVHEWLRIVLCFRMSPVDLQRHAIRSRYLPSLGRADLSAVHGGVSCCHGDAQLRDIRRGRGISCNGRRVRLSSRAARSRLSRGLL